MYLPRNLISHLYANLLRSHHPLSPPVLILAALDPDALCACRIFTMLLKRDYIQHTIQPIAGYNDLSRAGTDLVQPMRTTDGGNGGVVVCMGLGGLVDLAEILGLESDDGVPSMGGVEVWVLDSRRPWNLGNIFGGKPELTDGGQEDSSQMMIRAGTDKGCITEAYKSGTGGIVVFDDGDIEEELMREREAYYSLEEMPELGEEVDSDDVDSDSESEDELVHGTRKRKSGSGHDENSESDLEDGPPRQRRRSNSVRIDCQKHRTS